MQLSELRVADVDPLLPGALLVVDADGKVTDADSAGWKMLGGRAEPGTLALADSFVDPREKIERYLKLCGRTRDPLPAQLSLEKADGSFVSYRVKGAAPRGAAPGSTCLYFIERERDTQSHGFNVLNQTVERLKREIRARAHIEAILEAEKDTLASVVQGEPLIDALNILVRAIEDHSDGMLVSILLVDEENRLRHVVAPSLPDDYVRDIDGVAIGPDVGSCGTAAHTGLTVIATDIATDPRWTDYRGVAESAGLRACWSCPIKASDDKVLGTLAMYFRYPREPSKDELRLITNSAYVASVAIERFRSQEMLTQLLFREQKAREDAEAQNAAKDEFLAMLGHELRNPLGAITNAAVAIEAGNGASAPSGSLSKIIISESRLLKRILDDLLDISRLSRGKLHLFTDTFSLDDFVDEIRAATNATYPNRKFLIPIHSGLGLMSADRSRLRQSVQNLIDNAVKYSEAGDTVAVEFTAAADDVTITVSDSGHGIDPEALETIFEPFVQSDKSLARTNSGLGLGLALVKRFARMHGGDITAESDGLGCGSVFTMTLPRGKVDAATVSGERVVKQAAAQKKVLVVEDNESAREGLCKLLQLWGHEVLEAGDGQQALDVIREARPDVALVDIGLPVVDGYAVARSVRQEPERQPITLVALTGYGQSTDRDRAIAAGFDTHMVKPADIDELKKLLGAPAL